MFSLSLHPRQIVLNLGRLVTLGTSHAESCHPDTENDHPRRHDVAHQLTDHVGMTLDLTRRHDRQPAAGRD